MNRQLKIALGASALLFSSLASAQVTFYENDSFHGRAFEATHPMANLERAGFNDRASSVIVDRDSWEVCEDAYFKGRCSILRRGNYPSLSVMGMNDRISSARPVANDRRNDNAAPEPVAAAPYEYRRRPNEQTFEARVTSVHAVVGPPEQRCWVEHQERDSRAGPNVGGAIAGALIGGVLGHQIGNGRGNDLATAGGAVAGGAIGANAGRGGNNSYGEDVRRCETTSSATPAYWDVTYDYRGVQHRVQMSAAPGPMIAVNRDGLPRG
jgi:uncharacterized protein YcfJ